MLHPLPQVASIALPSDIERPAADAAPIRHYSPLKGLYRGPYSAAEVETKNHHKTMKFGVPEAEILRTPIKIEKLSLWNRSGGEFIMIFEFHGFQRKNIFLYFYKVCPRIL